MSRDLACEASVTGSEISAPGKVTSFLYLVYFIYFFCGLTQCFEGVFLPEFKEYFHLTYQQQMYAVFAKNIPFLGAVLLGNILHQLGYRRCLSLAMALFAAGTLLLVPGLATGSYKTILAGFLLIGSGFTAQMVAGNPLLNLLGPAESASSRQNLGNALGAVAQIVAPAAVSALIPAAIISVRGKLPYMQGLFATLGLVLCAVSLLVPFFRNEATLFCNRPQQANPTFGKVWAIPSVVLGFVAIFLVLGLEAGLFSFFRNYLEEPSIAGLSSHASERLFTAYFAVFALGRLAASWIQKRVLPVMHLSWHLVAAICLLIAMIFSKGAVAVLSVLLIGFFVSMFFPTLLAMALRAAGPLVTQASGLLTLGFLGCAFVPLLQGKLADTFGLQRSYALGLIIYPAVLIYVRWMAARERQA
jgi:FHS family L-fucose permease-like MFS transporter